MLGYLKKQFDEYLHMSEKKYNFDEPQFNINENNIILGNGASEIIDLIISSFKNVLIVVPSFLEYEKDV